MQHDWFGPTITLAVVLLFLVFGIVAMRRMAARRRADFSEVTPPEGLKPPAPRPEPGVPGVPAARVGTLDAPVAKQADEEAAEYEEKDAAPPAVARPARPTEVPDEALKAGLAKTQAGLLGRINALLGRSPKVDAAVLDELEEVMLTADLGVGLATRFLEDLRARLKKRELESADAVREALRDRLLAALAPEGDEPVVPDVFAAGGPQPKVILFVGVNGVGKTTSIGKIAAQLTGQGKKVLLAAGDTFRAAAAEQLAIWGERTHSRVVRGEEGSDPASVIFNAIDAAKQSGVDVVLADTAGRLHTKTELMDEIKKVRRAASKARDNAPDETWLVVDATTGQNALQQAREFHQTLGLTGVILTKLDGTAKGGVVVAIVDALHIPVRFVGVGEQASDLRPFNPHSFVSALFGGA